MSWLAPPLREVVADRGVVIRPGVERVSRHYRRCLTKNQTHVVTRIGLCFDKRRPYKGSAADL